MPKESIGKPVTEEKAAGKALEPQEPKKQQEPKFKVEKLREKCMEIFGITVSTFDGAMYGNKEKELTISAARAVINKWLRKDK